MISLEHYTRSLPAFNTLLLLALAALWVGMQLMEKQPQTAVSQPATQQTAVSLTTPYAAEIEAAANRYGLDPLLLAALVTQESGFNPNICSYAGACGLTQLMPATAAELGVTDRYDVHQNLDGGARYLRQQLDRFGDVRLALAAYNAGPGRVGRCGCIPPGEASRYVPAVLGHYEALQR